MGQEEQAEEREVLSSIFPDELEDISATQFRIRVLLEPTSQHDDIASTTILLHVGFPPAYPESCGPDLDLLPCSDGDGGGAHPFLDLTADRPVLLASLAATVEENLGMAMVFALYATLKEHAEQLMVERQAVERDVRERAILAAEAEENKKFHGTPVTPESFVRWRDAFLKEMEAQRLKDVEDEAAEKKKHKVKEPGQALTGRQLWERGLAGKVDEEDDDDEVLDETKMAKLSV